MLPIPRSPIFQVVYTCPCCARDSPSVPRVQPPPEGIDLYALTEREWQALVAIWPLEDWFRARDVGVRAAILRSFEDAGLIEHAQLSTVRGMKVIYRWSERGKAWRAKIADPTVLRADVLPLTSGSSAATAGHEEHEE